MTTVHWKNGKRFVGQLIHSCIPNRKHNLCIEILKPSSNIFFTVWFSEDFSLRTWDNGKCVAIAGAKIGVEKDGYWYVRK